MVTWANLQTSKVTMAAGEAPSLMMSGVVHDNATAYLQNQKGNECVNNDQIFATATTSAEDYRDFVWFRNSVRVAGRFDTGGHPSLAGYKMVYCAGRVAQNTFDFHSGHYHPKLRNVVYYMFEFIENSCQNLHGAIRDKKVDDLCKIDLQLYYDDSETEKFRTTFEEIINAGQLERSKGARSTMTMGVSRPHPMYQQPSASRVPFNSTRTIVETGVTPHVQHLGTFRVQNRANWVNDDECTKCLSCRRDFGVFRRKHHCRQCGQVFCDDCSRRTKDLKRPAIRPGIAAETGPVRVCDTCYTLKEL